MTAIGYIYDSDAYRYYSVRKMNKFLSGNSKRKELQLTAIDCIYDSDTLYEINRYYSIRKRNKFPRGNI